MSLLHPEFLFALAVLAIPIIIHLFNFRRFKKVVFPNVRFLKKVDLKTRSKNKLKHLLVLFSRLLALTCLVLAFARPFIPANENSKAVDERAVAVYVDNSYSMDLENDKGSLLSQAITIAEGISEAHDRNDRFMLLTNDLRPEDQVLVSAEAFEEKLGGIQQSPASRSYAEIYERASDALSKSNADARSLYYISDFQQSSFDPINARLDTSMSTSLVRLEQKGQGNVYIDSIWFQSPVRSIHNAEKLAVRVTNASNKELFDLPLRLTIEGQQKAIGNMSLKPFSTVDSVLTFTNPSTGWMKGRVSLNDNPITFDDEMHFAYQVKEDCNVLIIGSTQDSKAIDRIFKNDPFFNITQSDIRQLDLSSLKEQDFVILTEIKQLSSGLISELAKFVGEGGSICLIPDADVDRNSINEFLLSINGNTIIQTLNRGMKVKGLDVSHPLFTDVFDQVPENMDLPSVSSYYSFSSRVQSNEERILTLQDGNSLLSAFSKGKGKTYVFASSIDRESSNLTSHSLFVTSLLRMAEMSTSNPPIFHEIGKERPVALRLGDIPSDAVFAFRDIEGGLDFIPEQRSIGSETQFFDRGQVSSSGIYSIESDGEQKALVAYNFNRKESKMDFTSEELARKELERNGSLGIEFLDVDELSSGKNISASIAGKQLWRYFIILALIFLGIEVLLLKFWKS